MSIRSDGSSGNYLEINDVSGPLAWDYNAAYTFCIWFKPEDVTSVFETMFTIKSDVEGGSFDTLTHYDDGGGDNLELECPFAGTYQTPNPGMGTTSLSANTWYHGALRRSSATAVQGILNGTQEISCTQSSVATRFNAAILRLGCWDDLGSNFHGSLTQSRIWTAALSDAEIATEMASPTPVRTSNLWFDHPLPSTSDYTPHTDNSGGEGSSDFVPHGTWTNGADDPVQVTVNLSTRLVLPTKFGMLTISGG